MQNKAYFLRPPTNDPYSTPRWSARHVWHVDDKCLVSDRLKKSLQSALFQRFALPLGLHETGLDEKPLEVEPGMKRVQKKIIEGSKEVANQLVTIGATLISCTRPVVKACGALALACGGQLW